MLRHLRLPSGMSLYALEMHIEACLVNNIAVVTRRFNSTTTASLPKPLEGVRVLELGQVYFFLYMLLCVKV